VRRTSLILLAGVAIASPTFGQGKQVERRPEPPPADVRGETRRDAVDDPAEATRMLNRSLQDIEQRRERVREALRKIEQGTPVREAMRGIDLRPERGGDRRDGPGGQPRAREPGGLGEAMGQPGSRRMEHPPTPEQREHVRKFMREHLPKVADRMEKNEKENPEGFERGLTRLIPRIDDAEEVRTHDPKLFSLRVREIDGQIRVVEAIRADREAKESNDPSRIEQATQELRGALTAQMDTRLELQDHEIEGLTKRLEELRADVEKKRSGREAAIDEMLKRVREFSDRRSRERTQSEPRKDKADAPRQPVPPR
jgi:hypothetical protein